MHSLSKQKSIYTGGLKRAPDFTACYKQGAWLPLALKWLLTKPSVSIEASDCLACLKQGVWLHKGPQRAPDCTACQDQDALLDWGPQKASDCSTCPSRRLTTLGV